MKTWTLMTSGLALAALLLGPLYAGDDTKRTWTFDDDATGQIAKGFTNEAGASTVVDSDSGKALAQTAESAGPAFNVTLIDGTNAKDVDLSVKVKAVEGKRDQGGGLVWRAKDAKNYYIARYNHLEDNYRVYKVVDGRRSQPFQNADIKHHDGWTTLRVTMTGDHIECYYDGKKYLDVHDSTFPEAGKIGLWSKADARSQFDELTLKGADDDD
jgi:Domain of Unknown Function (DUF1080)